MYQKNQFHTEQFITLGLPKSDCSNLIYISPTNIVVNLDYVKVGLDGVVLFIS